MNIINTISPPSNEWEELIVSPLNCEREGWGKVITKVNKKLEIISISNILYQITG